MKQSGSREVPTGHPVDIFRKENKELKKVVSILEKFYAKAPGLSKGDLKTYMIQLRAFFSNLSETDKHYGRLEKLLFPFLKKYGVDGPVASMPEKYKEIRQLLKAARNALSKGIVYDAEEIGRLVKLVLRPASAAVEALAESEEESLFRTGLENLSEKEWYDIQEKSAGIGFCLFEPENRWTPYEGNSLPSWGDPYGIIMFPTGSASGEEFMAMFTTIPVELTFVDRNDKVRFFSQGKNPVFKRTRAVIGKDVRLCHPPASMHLVENILDDFRTGRQDKAVFWFESKGKFVHVAYNALRNEKNEYIGTLEVVQDATALRNLKGEQRLLEY